MSRKEKYPRLSEMPYYNTRVSADRTREEIIKLLEKYGIEDHQWTKWEGKETIKFVINAVVQGTQIKKAVQFEIPVIKALFRKKTRIGGKTRAKTELVEVPKAQGYRIFYHSLKSVLESTKYGVLSLEHILFSYTLTQLSTGETVQVKDLLEKHPLMLQTGFEKND